MAESERSGCCPCTDCGVRCDRNGRCGQSNLLNYKNLYSTRVVTKERGYRCAIVAHVLDVWRGGAQKLRNGKRRRYDPLSGISSVQSAAFSRKQERPSTGST